MYSLVNGKGGLASYLDTKSGEEVEARIAAGDDYAELVYSSMVYHVAKEIGAMATVLKGDVRAIGITGGLAHSKLLTTKIKEYVRYIAPIYVFPGELEMQALAEGAVRVLSGAETVKNYEAEAQKLEAGVISC